TVSHLCRGLHLECLPYQRPQAYGHAERAAPDEGPGGAQEDHPRHPALCRGASVLRVPERHCGHSILGAVCQEFWPQYYLRLRQPHRCSMVGSLDVWCGHAPPVLWERQRLACRSEFETRAPRHQTRSYIAIDAACRSHYNAPARLECWLTPSLVAEYELAYAAHISLAILSTASTIVPPLSGPF